MDEIGNWEKAVASANRLAKTSKANLVTYQQPFDLSSLFRLFGKSDVGRIKVDLGFELSRLKVGQLYFLVPGMVR